MNKNISGMYKYNYICPRQSGGEIAYIPIMSDGTFPLLNLPVGIPPLKSFPYGGKLQRALVSKLLSLLPVSTIESPNTKSAGTEIFGGSFTNAIVFKVTININKKRISKEGRT